MSDGTPIVQAWMPWKSGDVLPPDGKYFVTIRKVRARWTNLVGPKDFERQKVIAYLLPKMPAPFEAAQSLGDV